MTAVLTSGAHAKRAGSSAISFAAHRRELGTIAVSIPFFAYTACFLLAPTVIVIVGAFQSADGSFTVANFNKLFEANTIAAFGTSILVSVASAVIGAIVGALLILPVSFMKAIWFVVFLIVLQQIEGNLIYPHVVGKSVGLPGIWVFFAVIVGSGLGGVAGMLLGVPVCAVIYDEVRRTMRKKEAALTVSDNEKVS